jgi:uncharacterized protein involved in tolerance to divalent cations
MKKKDQILLENAYDNVMSKRTIKMVDADGNTYEEPMTSDNDVIKELKDIKEMVRGLYDYNVPEDTVLDFEHALIQAMKDIIIGAPKRNAVLQELIRLKKQANELYSYEVPEDLVLDIESSLNNALRVFNRTPLR